MDNKYNSRIWRLIDNVADDIEDTVNDIPLTRGQRDAVLKQVQRELADAIDNMRE